MAQEKTRNRPRPRMSGNVVDAYDRPGAWRGAALGRIRRLAQFGLIVSAAKTCGNRRLPGITQRDGSRVAFDSSIPGPLSCIAVGYSREPPVATH